MPTGQYEEGEVSDPNQDASVTNTNQASTDEQNYRDNAWYMVLYGLDSHSRHWHSNIKCWGQLFCCTQTTASREGQCEFTNRWLAMQENGRFEPDTYTRIPVQKFWNRGLQMDQFVKHSKSHVKWYGLHPNQDILAGSVSFCHCDSAKLNSAYSRIARSSRLTSPASTSHTYLRTCSDVGRRLQESPPMCATKQPDSVGVLVRSSKVCRHRSEFGVQTNQ